MCSIFSLTIKEIVIINEGKTFMNKKYLETYTLYYIVTENETTFLKRELVF